MNDDNNVPRYSREYGGHLLYIIMSLFYIFTYFVFVTESYHRHSIATFHSIIVQREVKYWGGGENFVLFLSDIYILACTWRYEYIQCNMRWKHTYTHKKMRTLLSWSTLPHHSTGFMRKLEIWKFQSRGLKQPATEEFDVSCQKHECIFSCIADQHMKLKNGTLKQVENWIGLNHRRCTRDMQIMMFLFFLKILCVELWFSQFFKIEF